VTTADPTSRQRLLRRGFALEYATLGWNIVGLVVLAVTAIAARSVALAGFGLDPRLPLRSWSPSPQARPAPAQHWTTQRCAPKAA
jgi:hypothetical protein